MVDCQFGPMYKFKYEFWTSVHIRFLGPMRLLRSWSFCMLVMIFHGPRLMVRYECSVIEVELSIRVTRSCSTITFAEFD